MLTYLLDVLVFNSLAQEFAKQVRRKHYVRRSFFGLCFVLLRILDSGNSRTVCRRTKALSDRVKPRVSRKDW